MIVIYLRRRFYNSFPKRIQYKNSGILIADNCRLTNTYYKTLRTGRIS